MKLSAGTTLEEYAFMVHRVIDQYLFDLEAAKVPRFVKQEMAECIQAFRKILPDTDTILKESINLPTTTLEGSIELPKLVDRLDEELLEVKGRIIRAKIALKSADHLSDDHKHLLEQQIVHMQGYADVLASRIFDLEGEA